MAYDPPAKEKACPYGKNCALIQKTCDNAAKKKKMQMSNSQEKAKLPAAYRENGRDKRARYTLSKISPTI